MNQPKHNHPLLIGNGIATNELNDSNDKLLDKQDILQMLHMSVRTLQYWRTKGILPYIKIGNKIFYKLSDVEEMLRKNKVVKK